MNILVLIPRVVSRFIASFPETTNNAYKYFNYDHRVVEERVPRGDVQSQYVGPQDFTDQDYDMLVESAKGNLNKVLARYSPSVACEDALHMAIRSTGNGRYDGKIDASKYQVLLGELKTRLSIPLNITDKYRHS